MAGPGQAALTPCDVTAQSLAHCSYRKVMASLLKEVKKSLSVSDLTLTTFELIKPLGACAILKTVAR